MPGSTTLLNTVTLSEMTDLVEKEFKMQQEMIQPVAKQLFIMDAIAGNSGNTRRYDEIDTETYAATKPEGVDASLAQVGTGYYVTGTVKRIAKEVQITWEMRRFNKFPEVTGQLTSLTHFCPQRVELDLTHRITFGNASSYTDRDGNVVDTTVGDTNVLFYSLHALKYSTATYTNLVSGAPRFSQGGLEAAEALTVSDILSNFGERRVMHFNTIWSSDDPNTCREIKQVLQSTTDIDQNNPGVINVFQSKYRHLVLPMLATTATGARNASKAKWWGIGSFGMGINGWQAYFGEAEAPNLKSPSTGNNGEDFHNDNWSYGVRSAYLIAVLSGRGIIASLAS